MKGDGVLKNILYLFFGGVSHKLNLHLALMRIANSKGWNRLSKIVSWRIQSKYLIYISRHAEIPKSTKFPHPTGIVIGSGVVLGEQVKIYQNVTLGGARVGDWQANNYPSIGSNTVIFAGAVIVGKIKVGANCIIGANSVVLSDVPDNAIAVGVPARIILDKNPRN